ncbi:hypothetical protein PS718_00523 [Pseudomonas fluorescens]|uniref:Uncharacterized protein n=1 Tax=Pseudomonas fluorescens TaxID=294 RepID=A0A5E7AC97_PSEFL|nr:hypothetical protein PS718_00523 [Pseudomonas fluorescens]
MKRFIEGETRTQFMLLPECLDDYVAEDPFSEKKLVCNKAMSSSVIFCFSPGVEILRT